MRLTTAFADSGETGRGAERWSRPFTVVAVALAALALAVACDSGGAEQQPIAVVVTPGPIVVGEARPDSIYDASSTVPYLLFNQRLIQGLYSQVIDLDDVDAVFGHIFSRLPHQVTVYPTENYYYFIMFVNGRQIWGNIRLPAGRRDRGVLSFGYFEFKEASYGPRSDFQRSKFFTQADGLRIEKIDNFTYVVDYTGKSVTFNLSKLPQDPPRQFALGEDEVFLERTFDESGFQFFLLFNERKNYFFWVLNEEDGVVDTLTPMEDDLLVGVRSGFAFWVDSAHDDRKISIAVRGSSATRNDYYDGPFDQLADNYVDDIGISEYMIRAFPTLEGRIDKYGYFMDRETPSRVSLYTYFVYFSESSLEQFVANVRQAEDPYQYVSRRGRPTTPVPTPQPSTSR